MDSSAPPPRRAVAVTRILVGLFFVLAGEPKLTDPEHWAGNLRHWHVPLPAVAVLLVGVLETVGGALLMLGVVPRMMSVLFVVDMIGAAAFAGGTDGPAYVVLPAILGTATAAYAAWGAGAWQWYPDHLLIARVRRRDPEVWISSGLLAGVVLTATLTMYIVTRHRIPISADPAAIAFLSALSAGLVVAVAAALTAPRLRDAAARGVMSAGCRWGLLCGALWVVEMVAANLGYGLGRWMLLPYFASSFAVVVLTILAGALGARRYGRMRAGVLVGVWSGLVSGLIGLTTMQILVVAAMPVLRHDPQNLAEFGGAADLSTAIAGDYLAGGINHLVLVGLAGGTALGALGAVLGTALKRPEWSVR